MSQRRCCCVCTKLSEQYSVPQEWVYTASQYIRSGQLYAPGTGLWEQETSGPNGGWQIFDGMCFGTDLGGELRWTALDYNFPFQAYTTDANAINSPVVMKFQSGGPVYPSALPQPTLKYDLTAGGTTPPNVPVSPVAMFAQPILLASCTISDFVVGAPVGGFSPIPPAPPPQGWPSYPFNGCECLFATDLKSQWGGALLNIEHLNIFSLEFGMLSTLSGRFYPNIGQYQFTLTPSLDCKSGIVTWKLTGGWYDYSKFGFVASFPQQETKATAGQYGPVVPLPGAFSGQVHDSYTEQLAGACSVSFSVILTQP